MERIIFGILRYLLQQTKSESNRILTNVDGLRNSSHMGVAPLDSVPLRKTIAIDVVGYLESGCLQVWALASVGNKQINLGRLLKLLARCSYFEERNKKYIQHCYCFVSLLVCFCFFFFYGIYFQVKNNLSILMLFCREGFALLRKISMNFNTGHSVT